MLSWDPNLCVKISHSVAILPLIQCCFLRMHSVLNYVHRGTDLGFMLLAVDIVPSLSQGCRQAFKFFDLGFC